MKAMPRKELVKIQRDMAAVGVPMLVAFCGSNTRIRRRDARKIGIRLFNAAGRRLA